MTFTADQLDILTPQHRKSDPPASRQGAAIKKATAKKDRELTLDALKRAGVEGRTAHEIDREYAWASRSGSPAGKRLSELIRYPRHGDTGRIYPEPPIVRLKAQRNRCHVHVLREFYDPKVHGETC